MASFKTKNLISTSAGRAFSCKAFEPQIEEYSARELTPLGIPQGRCGVTEGR